MKFGVRSLRFSSVEVNKNQDVYHEDLTLKLNQIINFHSSSFNGPS